MNADIGKETYVIKLGGSVITDKKSRVPKINYNVIERLAGEVARAYSERDFSLVVVHGAGSYGHSLAKEERLQEGIVSKSSRLAFGRLQRLQNELGCVVSDYLQNQGLPAMPCQASSHAVMRSGKLESMDTEVIGYLLELGMVPVVGGAPAYDRLQGCSILSSDELAPYLARCLHARKIIHVTDVDGVFTADPNVDSSAKKIPVITKGNWKEVVKALRESNNVDVTGGMVRKVEELLGAEVESQIVSGFVEGNVYRTLAGEEVGTAVKV